MQMVLNVVLIIALVGYVMYRQMQWREVNAGKLWRFPIILAVVGIFVMKGQTTSAFTGMDAGFLVLEAILALAVGALMGLVSQFRTESGKAFARTGGVGAALWIVFIAIRVGIDFWAGSVGAAIAASTGVILIMVALNRVGRAFVVLRRAPRGAVSPLASSAGR